ncbi:hypothetical protein AbraIFM66951_010779 [Aspergillus brasiliensis]|uniref:Uncharacterized protein n=1 Tax=Aspergillus brasiliensis TaxID=319629 RepID=A0A9W6DKE6_9EURO|nr:hypothetical protein AbraCBS73388_004791 [Aspergillus brasiliensis]GKZ47413.1 hypothetical protein AbraIFM66951_010779 [Aspergillus brasiliensis]
MLRQRISIPSTVHRFWVNCILTEACFYSDHPEAYADPTDRNSKGLHFYEEAKRWYDRVDGISRNYSARSTSSPMRSRP